MANQSGKLWNYVPAVLGIPTVRPAVFSDGSMPHRELTDFDLAPLKTRDEWGPTEILQRFGPAETPWEYLPRLLVACAVFQGVHRIRDMCDRLIAIANTAIPRLKRMLDEEALATRLDTIKEIQERLHAARLDLPDTRARALNCLEPRHPDGLRGIDLQMLVTHTMALVVASEVANKRNLTGLEFALHLASRLPDQRYVEDWLERTHGTSYLHNVLLYTPPEWGRVLVVYDDGRLAYDPGALLATAGG